MTAPPTPATERGTEWPRHHTPCPADASVTFPFTHEHGDPLPGSPQDSSKPRAEVPTTPVRSAPPTPPEKDFK